MKFFFVAFTLLTVLHQRLFAQLQVPVIKATSPVVDVRDGNDFRKGHWSILPHLQPDVYYADRYRGTKRVSFYTNIDSIAFTVEPSHTYDFAILLNGKDTAFTQIYTHLPPPLSMQKECNKCASDTVPFTFGRGNKIYLKGSINHSVPLDLMFDLGSNQVVLSKEGIAKGTRIRWEETKENVSFGGNNKVQSSSRNTLKIGGLLWDSVAIVGMEKADGDGIVGYNVFDGRIIEIDYENKWLIVHPFGFKAGAGYQPMALHFKSGLPFIEATLVNGSKEYKDYFEFDGGSNGSLWLNQAFASTHRLYETVKTIGNTTSHGLGGSIKNKTVLMPQIRIGNVELNQVPVDLELPSSQQHLTWGIFGMDVLKRFNVVIDFQKDSIYLKPNRLISEPYRQPFKMAIYLAGFGGVALLSVLLVMYRRRKKPKVKKVFPPHTK